MTKFYNELLDARNFNIPVYDANGNISKDYFPLAWYITNDGELYNTLDEEGHKESNLKYPLMDIRDIMHSKKKLPDDFLYHFCEEKKNYYTNKYLELIKSGKYDNVLYKEIFNYLYPSVSNNDPNVLLILKGALDANISFYSFFIKLCKYAKNPCYEFDKLMDLTNNEVEDLLVRCMDFDKTWVHGKKHILTSKIKVYKEFKDYLEKGFDVSYINPIILNSANGSYEEASSYFRDIVYAREVDEYEENRISGYGKII